MFDLLLVNVIVASFFLLIFFCPVTKNYYVYQRFYSVLLIIPFTKCPFINSVLTLVLVCFIIIIFVLIRYKLKKDKKEDKETKNGDGDPKNGWYVGGCADKPPESRDIPLYTYGVPPYKLSHGKRHPFHIVDKSGVPFFFSLGLFFLILGFVSYLHHYSLAGFLKFGIFLLFCNFYRWIREIFWEADMRYHNTTVSRGLRIGFILFICSEVMFFFSFFWAFFHFSLVPAVQIGAIWPPLGIESFSPWKIPFLNTLILLTSGLTITCAHFSLLLSKEQDALVDHKITRALGLLFLFLQYWEYRSSSFSISDSVYGSIFFMLTGFHGFHVLVGFIFLSLVQRRMRKYKLTRKSHLSFEFASWYWHFVDIVWIFLFTFVYIWAS